MPNLGPKTAKQAGIAHVMILTTNITSRLSLMLREKNTGPLEPVLNIIMLKVVANQIVNI